MAAPRELCFDDNFVDLPGFSNPPSAQASLASPPSDPLYDLIDSDRYIRNLENKLKKLKGGKKKEPTAKDMILSLEKSKEDHFRRLEQLKEDYVSNFVPNPVTSESDSSYSYLHRKIHPDRVAIDPEELVQLLTDIGVEKHEGSAQNTDTQDSCKTRVPTDVTTGKSSSSNVEKPVVSQTEDSKTEDLKTEDCKTRDCTNEDSLKLEDSKNEDTSTKAEHSDKC